MFIGLISDTHDNLDAVDTAFNFFHDRKIELVFHMGDWVSHDTVIKIDQLAQQYQLYIVGVLGNNDDYSLTSLDLKNVILADIFQTFVENIPIILYHGHHSNVLYDLIESSTASIILTGHTHKPKYEIINQNLVINPGSASFRIPRMKNDPGMISLLNPEQRLTTFISLDQPFLITNRSSVNSLV